MTIQSLGERVIANVEKVIVGKHREVELALAALICRGHILIEDVPGVGKTVMAKAIAKSIGCTFKRIQFTPDLLPSDVTGVSIYNQRLGEFEYRPGPIMAQIVLADEINRATPKTQSALLECMEELQVTVDGQTHLMPRPFLVLATQNPIEYEGTFPLPEAQLDRFLIRLSLGYPNRFEEMAILEQQQITHPVDELSKVAEAEELVEAQEVVRRSVYVDPLVREYIVSIVAATRQHPDVYLGASPRGSLALFRTGQARAALRGRDYVIPDDIKALTEPALAHRIILNSAARIRNVSARSIIEEIADSVRVPGSQVPTSSGA
ncbi:MAG: AAA family ATPase [Chloroflexota bacterium]